MRLVGTAGVNQLYEANSSTSSNTSHEAHLYTTPDTGNDVIPSMPPAHNAGFDITKCEQGDSHHTDTPVQGRHDLRHNEVGNEGDETTHEVTNGKCESRDPSLVTIRRSLAVVEGQQELQQALRRGVQVACNIFDGGAGESVGRECLTDHILCFLRVALNQCLCFTDGGLV